MISKELTKSENTVIAAISKSLLPIGVPLAAKLLRISP